eukprot:3952102-Pleurochrysis_carterae.AAC.1
MLKRATCVITRAPAHVGGSAREPLLYSRAAANSERFISAEALGGVIPEYLLRHYSFWLEVDDSGAEGRTHGATLGVATAVATATEATAATATAATTLLS